MIDLDKKKKKVNCFRAVPSTGIRHNIKAWKHIHDAALTAVNTMEVGGWGGRLCRWSFLSFFSTSSATDGRLARLSAAAQQWTEEHYRPLGPFPPRGKITDGRGEVRRRKGGVGGFREGGGESCCFSGSGNVALRVVPLAVGSNFSPCAFSCETSPNSWHGGSSFTGVLSRTDVG